MSHTSKQTQSLISQHYLLRTLSFALLFVAASLHLANQTDGLGKWLASGLLLLFSPHFQYWRACKASHHLQAERRNLLIDAVVIGLVVATLGFPLWISSTAILAVLAIQVVQQGWRGAFQAALALLAGALTAIACGGFGFAPLSNWPVIIICIGFWGTYLLLSGTRHLHLRLNRDRSSIHEQELLAANRSLQKKIEEISELQKQLREDANRDPLTGLYNRRYFDSTLGRELARCKRDNKALALLLIDIDHFKRINDTHGHLAGDQGLKAISRLLLELSRSSDLACRYGGEEFLLLMPTMDLSTAQARAEKVRAAVAAMRVTVDGAQLELTVSIGIAVYPLHGGLADELIDHADRALYRAKDGGRNRVML